MADENLGETVYGLTVRASAIMDEDGTQTAGRKDCKIDETDVGEAFFGEFGTDGGEIVQLASREEDVALWGERPGAVAHEDLEMGVGVVGVFYQHGCEV